VDLQLVLDNLTSPPVLAFLLAIVATLIGSDLRLPDAVATLLSVYLLLAIGLKGGAELREAGFASIWQPGLATAVLAVISPLVAFALFTRVGGLDRVDGGALAAHYGSVSAVTFTAALAFVANAGTAAPGYLAALVAFLEVPGIVIGVVLARRGATEGVGDLRPLLREVLTGKSIILLGGGVLIGFAGGKEGLEKVAPLFVAPFQGVLVLFLLEMGVLAATRMSGLKRAGWPVAVLAVVVPLINGTMAVLLASRTDLGVGGITVLAAMVASASYIAAPAAVRIALPAADPGIYVTTSLGITFPFNLVLGIPLYYALAKAVT
jgi:uncharacterized protein